MTETVDEAKTRRSYDDTVADMRLKKVREKIQRNMPKATAPLRWMRHSATQIVSTCNRFAVEKVGEGDAARFNALFLPHTIIGHRRYSADLAKEDCYRHASPLPLEPPPPVVDREPGSDDDAP